MSTPYEHRGRTRQKSRTRAALVAAARTIIAAGGTPPTVEAAATAAAVSRTTAYRYFPSQKALLVAAHPETDTRSLLPDDIGNDPGTRLRAAADAFIGLIIDTEVQQRTMLRLSLEAEPEHRTLPLRQGRAIGWFEDALSPLDGDFSAADIRRLAMAIRSAIGIESLVWLTDVAGLDRDQAGRLMRWSARALLTHALAHGMPVDPATAGS